MKAIGKHVRTRKTGKTLFAVFIFIIGAIIYAHSDSPKIWYLVALVATGLIWWGAIALVHGLEKPEMPEPTARTDSPALATPAPIPPTTRLHTSIQPSTNPTTSPAVSDTATTKLSDGRTIVNVTPEYLSGFYAQNMDIQAQKLIAPFIGKLMKITGTVKGVTDRSPHFIAVDLAQKVTPDMVILNSFFRTTWRDKLEVLKPGDKITFIGRIDKVRKWSVDLEDCELVD